MVLVVVLVIFGGVLVQVLNTVVLAGAISRY